MNSDTSVDEPNRDQSGSDTETLSAAVDWAVTLLLVLGGILFGGLGAIMFTGADRTQIARLVAEGTIESDVLTNAELVDATYALFWWGGVGLLVTGVLLAVAGVAYIAFRRRSRNPSAESTGTGSTRTLNAIVGAVVTVVASFIPLSPIVGGAVAGYLEGGDGVRTGGLSGVIATLPVILVFVFLAAGLVMAGFSVVAVVMLLALVFAFAYTVLLSALGGYVGEYVVNRD